LDFGLWINFVLVLEKRMIGTRLLDTASSTKDEYDDEDHSAR
jgi:hypothetical protein